MAFIDLDKAFDTVPREVIWWALRESEVEERLISVIKSMYDGWRNDSRQTGTRERKKFPVRVDVHQGSVLSPLLFINVLLLSKKFRKGLPYELLYVDNLVVISRVGGVAGGEDREMEIRT